ncbi:MAG: 2-isopropylmalate synthase [Candidatus Bathyarchaeia archaeon]
MYLSNEWPERVYFFDTTLRDGEQTPGVSLTPDRKLRIAERLDALGVDVIEAGFAASSEGELEAVRLIASQGLKAEVSSFARGLKSDIDAILRSGAKGVHLVIPTSDIHIQRKLRKTRDEVLKITEECVTYAKKHGLIVELSAEDATRSDIEFLKRMFSTGVSAGADRICSCDTVGILTPDRSYRLFSELRKEFSIPISAHCHDDFGLAVANSLAALAAGARQVHVTVNGIGERAGNAALEEIAMALKALYRTRIELKTELLYDTSRLVSRLTGIALQPNKAIVGDNAFTHESGIHTHAILIDPSTYEPISPEMVGARRRLIPGKHAGTHGILASLKEMGIEASPEQVREIFKQVKELGDRGKRVTDVDLQAIAEAVIGLPKIRPIQLKELTVVTGNMVTPMATVRLIFNGKELTEAATGTGPVDAAINAIRKAITAVEPIHLEQYSVKAITGGTDAIVEVEVRLRKEDRVVTAIGVRSDIVMASVEAMISGMNVLTTDYNKQGRSQG